MLDVKIFVKFYPLFLFLQAVNGLDYAEFEELVNETNDTDLEKFQWSEARVRQLVLFVEKNFNFIWKKLILNSSKKYHEEIKLATDLLFQLVEAQPDYRRTRICKFIQFV